MTLFSSRLGGTIRSATLAASLAGMAALAPSPAAAQLTPQQEWAAHPNLARAVREMDQALHVLQQTPDDFGGNKNAAMRDLQAGIISLKRAIFYRLRMDDAAIQAWGLYR